MERNITVGILPQFKHSSFWRLIFTISKSLYILLFILLSPLLLGFILSPRSDSDRFVQHISNIVPETSVLTVGGDRDTHYEQEVLGYHQGVCQGTGT